MNTQIVVTIFHVLWSYLFLIYLDYGIKGIGVSSFITNLFGLILNIYYTEREKDETEI